MSLEHTTAVTGHKGTWSISPICNVGARPTAALHTEQFSGVFMICIWGHFSRSVSQWLHI